MSIDFCTELLLSGVLAIHGKSPDIAINNVIYSYPSAVVYAVPDKYNITLKKCKNTELMIGKGIKMNSFLKKID